MLLFKIFERDFSYTDIVDFVIVVLLMIQLFRMVRGTIVYNISIGIFVFYIAYILAKFTRLELLQDMLGQFINVGVIALLIVFQPEIRKFLLLIGKVSFTEQFRFFRKGKIRISQSAHEHLISDLQHSLHKNGDAHTLALLFSESTGEITAIRNGVPGPATAADIRVLESRMGNPST